MTTMNAADRPKAIALILAIVAVFAFIGFRFISGAKKVAPPPPGYDATLAVPSTSSIASGQIVAANTTTPAGENLHNVFSGEGTLEPVSNPFRSPVPAPKGTTGPQNTQPPIGGNRYDGPDLQNPNRDITIGGNKPWDVNGQGTSIGDAQPGVATGVLVKGIIRGDDPWDSLAFIEVGGRAKGYRVGQEIAPGMKLVGITSTKVSVKIGANVVKAGVGQEVKPF
jgi:hypothetical protein